MDETKRDDFDDIERQLRARADNAGVADRSAAEALRPRVLAAMRAASAERNRAATPLWVFASGAAAAVVLLANLSVSAAQARPLVAVHANKTSAIAAELRLLLPELDEHEAVRQALILEARGRAANSGVHQIQNRPILFSNAEYEP